MNVFDERSGAPSSPRSLGWYWLRVLAQDLTSPGRAVMAIAVVFVLLATSGWTAMRHERPPQDPHAAAVSAWLRGSMAGHHLPDPGTTGAAAVARFFGSLGKGQQYALADRYPLVVGNLNGAPFALRYRANQLAIAQAQADEEHLLTRPGLTADGRLVGEQLIHRYEDLRDPGRQILAFDPNGRGRVAEVFGDLANAERTAVVVPGVDTDLLTFERTSKPYSSPLGMAQALYDSERAAAPNTRIAVIAWADYTTPEGVGLDASTGADAAAGAVRLNAMLRGLPDRVPVELFCHSYGSVLCGVAAARLPSSVTDITVFGSPGMRAANVAGLRTRARVWAARDATDWIQDVPYLEFAGLGHGTDPVSPAFGARVVSAAGAQDHTGYFQNGTESLRNFTRIALGEYGSVRCAADARDCTAGVPAV